MRIKKIALPFFITVALTVIFMFIYAPVFAINDDVMIESILSGSYYRVYPYTYYFSAPLGWIISALYHVGFNIPWFGIFIMMANICSIFAIEYVACNRVYQGIKKIIPILFSIAFILALLFSGFVLPHYTVVAATLGAAGLALFITSDSSKEFTIPIIFFVMAYLVRENVFFMLLPFIGVVFIYLIISDKERDIKRYCICALGFIVTSLVCIAINRLVPGSNEWKEYKNFNDIRTAVYDYTGIPNFDDASDYYESNGISEKDIDIIRSYNITLAEQSVVQKKLELIAEYVRNKKSEEGFIARLKDAIIAYKYRLFNEDTDAPYNYMLLAMYAVVVATTLLQKKLIRLIPVTLLGVYGRAIWIYLFYQGRYPERVTLSLYIIELTILTGFLLRLVKESIEQGGLFKVINTVAVAYLGITLVIGSVAAISRLDIEHSKVCNTNSSDDVIYSYMYGHLDDYYFMDVYATVARTKNVLEASKYSPKNYKLDGAFMVPHSPENYLLLGGWMVGHPLYNEKLNAILDDSGAATICDALKNNSRFHIVVKAGEGADKELLSELVGAEARLVDSVESDTNIFYIYSFCD